MKIVIYLILLLLIVFSWHLSSMASTSLVKRNKIKYIESLHWYWYFQVLFFYSIINKILNEVNHKIICCTIKMMIKKKMSVTFIKCFSTTQFVIIRHHSFQRHLCFCIHFNVSIIFTKIFLNSLNSDYDCQMINICSLSLSLSLFLSLSQQKKGTACCFINS